MSNDKQVPIANIEVVVTISYTATVPIYKEQNFTSMDEMLEHAKGVGKRKFDETVYGTKGYGNPSIRAYFKNST